MEKLDSLPHLVKLLDDDDPDVRRSLSQIFAKLDGNLSSELSEHGIELAERDQHRLSELLAPGRRRQVRRGWIVPTQGLESYDGDWSSFELLLRLISELLHDGTTLRPSLPDAIDNLADEVVLHDAHHNEEDLCAYLFGSGRFQANSQGYYEACNSDLLWVIQHRRSNPLGLACLAMLVARRLDLNLFGCNFPGHFLAWIGHSGEPKLVDCYHRGRIIPLPELRSNLSALSPEARQAIRVPCTLRDILCRVLANLRLAFSQEKRTKDLELIEALISSLTPKE